MLNMGYWKLSKESNDFDADRYNSELTDGFWKKKKLRPKTTARVEIVRKELSSR